MVIGKVSLNTVPMYERTFLYPEETILLLRSLKKDYFKNWLNIYFALQTGARYNEIRHVKVSDIYFQIPMVNFRVTKGRGKSKKGGKKIGKPRQVKISEDLASAIKKYVSKNKLELDDYLFTMANSTLSRAIQRVLSELGHPNPEWFSMHNIRKTHITYRIALGDSLNNIVLDTGHSEEVSRKVYASADLFTFEHKMMMIDLLNRKMSIQ